MFYQITRNRRKETNDEIVDYTNTQVIYLAYVGIRNGQHILKFGATKNYPYEELKGKKIFSTYNIIKIWSTDKNYAIK